MINRGAILLIIYLGVVSCGVSRNAILPQRSPNEFYREYPRLSDDQVDSLALLYSTNKIFVEEFLQPTLIALSYYPELSESKIEFKYSSEATTMAARPKPLSMFGRRSYVVCINNSEEFDGIHLSDVPFNAQIGIIAHELAHIADYKRHNFGGVLGILMRYSSKRRKPLFEKEIDLATIQRGLGWQLHDWAQFALSDESGAGAEYREFKRTHYLTPEEIREYINLYGRYCH